MYTTYAYKLMYTCSFICICIYVYLLYTNILIMRYIKLDLKINKSMLCYIHTLYKNCYFRYRFSKEFNKLNFILCI